MGLGDYDAILQNTDLVLYDVKHEDPAAYQALTGQPIGRTHAFVEAVRRAGVPMWVRHVVVPGVTDGESHLERLAQYVRTLPNVQRVELLPYHFAWGQQVCRARPPLSTCGCARDGSRAV